MDQLWGGGAFTLAGLLTNPAFGVLVDVFVLGVLFKVWTIYYEHRRTESATLTDRAEEQAANTRALATQLRVFIEANNALRVEIDELREDVEVARRERHELDRRLDQEQREKHELCAELERTNQRLVELNAQIEALNHTLEEMRAELEHERVARVAEQEARRQEQDRYAGERAALQRRVAELEQQVSHAGGGQAGGAP